MKPSSYIRKLALILASRSVYKKNFLDPNLYLFNLTPEDLPRAHKILFELNDPEYIHLGDHLFFIPLIKSMLDQGYELEVHPSPLMYEIFKRLGLPVVSKTQPLQTYDLIISRFELIPRFSKFKSLFVHVSQNLTEPICSQLLKTFSKYFNKTFDSRPAYSIFKKPDILYEFSLPKDKKFILFNCYCDSSSYLISSSKRSQLITKLEEERSKGGYQVILLGTLKDKQKDLSVYPPDYIDLRGKTSVIQLFELANSPQVELYVGFDAFVMHIFSLVGKQSYVKFRGRLTKKQSKMLSQYHVHLFSGKTYVSLI